jgi:hypothetical protein
MPQEKPLPDLPLLDRSHFLWPRHPIRQPTPGHDTVSDWHRERPIQYRKGRIRILPASITNRFPDSLSTFVETTAATRSASAMCDKRSSSRRTTPWISSRWRTTSSPKSRSSVMRMRPSRLAVASTSLSDAPGFVKPMPPPRSQQLATAQRRDVRRSRRPENASLGG